MRRTLELFFGAGLLLGPFVYALTLTPASPDLDPSPPTSLPASVQPAPVCMQIAPENGAAHAPVSEPAPSPASAPAPRPGPIELALVGDNGLLLTTDAEPQWGTGRFYQPPGAAQFRVARRADPDRLPDDLAVARTRVYDLYGAEGKVCSARLGKLHVIAQYGEWTLEGPLSAAEIEHVDPENVPRRVWRRAVWNHTSHVLAGELIVEDGDCSAALWARDAELPDPVVLHGSDEATPEASARLERFAASARLRALRRDYDAWYAELSEDARGWEPDWASMVSEDPARVRSWLDGEGRVQLVELDFGRDFAGCGDGFDARLASLDRVADGEFVATERPPGVVAIFDADLDGAWEYLYAPGGGVELQVESSSLERVFVIERDWVCPC